MLESPSQITPSQKTGANNQILAVIILFFASTFLLPFLVFLGSIFGFYGFLIIISLFAGIAIYTAKQAKEIGSPIYVFFEKFNNSIKHVDTIAPSKTDSQLGLGKNIIEDNSRTNKPICNKKNILGNILIAIIFLLSFGSKIWEESEGTIEIPTIDIPDFQGFLSTQSPVLLFVLVILICFITFKVIQGIRDANTLGKQHKTDSM